MPTRRSPPSSASSWSALEDVFRRADVVSVSCPLTPETRHLVNAERLALMKPTAYLINTARGPIVDQKALTEVLQERRIAGAGLDVLEQEPPDADDPILKLDNVILAPHALCWTDQCFAGNGAADVKAVIEVQHGRDAARRRQSRGAGKRGLEEAARRFRQALRELGGHCEQPGAAAPSEAGSERAISTLRRSARGWSEANGSRPPNRRPRHPIGRSDDHE